MKRKNIGITVIALAFIMIFTLTACGSEDNSLAELRSSLEKEDAIAGIIYLGYHEGEDIPDMEDIDRMIDEGGYSEKYPFLKEIPAENFAENDGYEIYCIIPKDPGSSVLVTEWHLELESDGLGRPGKELYRSDKGEPFFIKGNYSDIMSNISVTIKESDGRELAQYQPYISLKDGKVGLPEDTQPKLKDLTIYQGQ